MSSNWASHGGDHFTSHCHNINLDVKANTGTYGRVPLEMVIGRIRLHTRI
jgi:hypothetical protein